MVLDMLKERSDDAFYSEEHIVFLASRMRALLLERKYKGSRNSTFQTISEQNYQQICLDLEPATDLADTCSGGWLKSTEKIPTTLSIGSVRVYPVSDVLFTNITYIPVERMPYVGYNKWLDKIVYCAKSKDGYIYLSSGNPQFMYLEKTRLNGVFANPEDAAKLACDDDGNANKCELLDNEFPLEEALIPSCVELIVQELAGPRYAPEDKQNNAQDDLGDVALTRFNTAHPVERAGLARNLRNTADETGVQ